MMRWKAQRNDGAFYGRGLDVNRVLGYDDLHKHFQLTLFPSLTLQDVTNKTRGADDRKAMMNLKPTVVAKRSTQMNIHVPSAAPSNTVQAQAMVLESRDPPAESSRGMNIASSSSFNSYQYVGQVDNIDERDSDDPLCVTSYVADMYAHFRGKESLTSVRPVYMEQNQSQINERMRSILVDWLVEVHLKFKLVPETLYLTVNLIDRFLERQPNVSRPKLQLVGVTCLLIASKYEEIYPPELRDLVCEYFNHCIVSLLVHFF